MRFVGFSVMLFVIVNLTNCDLDKEYNCSNTIRCSCSLEDDDFIATCRNLEPDFFPEFFDNVTGIDVRFNNLSRFPEKFPSQLRCLDISRNKFSIDDATVINASFLTTLKMDGNILKGNGEEARGMFNKLKSLQFLSMKMLKERDQLKNLSYPMNLFQRLVNLTNLHINGFGQANIGDLFSTSNSLTFLDMSGYDGTCDLPIIRKGMFANLRRIRHLSMSYCHIKRIEKSAFRDLHMLENLDISNNYELTMHAIPNVTFKINPGIKVLNFDKLQCTMGTSRVFKDEYVQYLKETQLETLGIASNRIAYLQRKVIDFLPKTLKHLNAGDNVLISGVYLFQTHRLLGLETLNVSYQFSAHQTFDDFFSTCDDSIQTTPSNTSCSRGFSESDIEDVGTLREGKLGDLDDKLQEQNDALYKKLWLSSCEHSCNFTFYMPPKLRILYLDSTHYSVKMNLPLVVSTLEPSTGNKTQLTHMYLNQNFVTEFLYPILGFDNLVHLDLSKNLMTNMSGARLNDAYKLRFLNLSFNFLAKSLEDEACEVSFSTLYSLENLDLSTNRLTSLARGLFRSLNNIQYLNFSFNKLDEWPIRMNHMKKLEELDLSLNSISVLSKQNMDDLKLLASHKLKKVNLVGNPLICTCNSFQFLLWLSDSTITTIFHDIHKYKCILSNNSAIPIGNISVFVERMNKECSTYTFAIVGASVLIVLFMVLTSLRIMYRYRWSLRYWYYVSRTTPKRYKNKHHFHFRYDAFISYDEEDTRIALQLVELLEINKKLKCCLPERDFMPGTNIADNIINAIHISRKIVCIISENYMKSYWSMFELQIGQMDAFHSKFRKDKNAFIAVLMRRNLRVESMNPSILGLLKSDCCIACTSDENVKVVCLEKVAELLRLDE